MVWLINVRLYLVQYDNDRESILEMFGGKKMNGNYLLRQTKRTNTTAVAAAEDSQFPSDIVAEADGPP